MIEDIFHDIYLLWGGGLFILSLPFIISSLKDKNVSYFEKHKKLCVFSFILAIDFLLIYIFLEGKSLYHSFYLSDYFAIVTFILMAKALFVVLAIEKVYRKK